MLGNSCLHLALTGEPRQTTNIMVIVLAAGLVLLSTRWLIFNLAAILLGWGAMAALLPPSPEWVHFGFALFSSTLLAAVAHFLRVSSLKRLQRLRILDEYHKQELQRFNQQLEVKVNERTIALRRAYDQLERLDRTKTNFISIASHELRTPLTVLKGYSQMLLNDPTLREREHQLKMLEGMHEGANRLQTILESMLDVAKIDSQTLTLRPGTISIAMLVGMYRDRMAAVLAERRLTLEMQDLYALPPIEADGETLKKVFDHLIGNAVKYTPDGGTVTVSGQLLPKGKSQLPVEGMEIIVQDTGIGIAPENQALIFTKFYQTGEVALHSSGTTKFKGGGPGLGLAIVKGIVEAHDGLIWVESPGHDETTCPGSAFHVLLPLRQNNRDK